MLFEIIEVKSSGKRLAARFGDSGYRGEDGSKKVIGRA
jgi:hypothetical protein